VYDGHVVLPHDGVLLGLVMVRIPIGMRRISVLDSTQEGGADITPGMVLRISLSDFIEPCLPTRAERAPSGPGWVHEIKHDGFRGGSSRPRRAYGY
jgi:hypothetical protein